MLVASIFYTAGVVVFWSYIEKMLECLLEIKVCLLQEIMISTGTAPKPKMDVSIILQNYNLCKNSALLKLGGCEFSHENNYTPILRYLFSTYLTQGLVLRMSSQT